MIFFTILVIAVFFLGKWLDWISEGYKKAISQPYNYYILLALLIIGFFEQWDYTERVGCISIGGSIFDFKNILFSSVSISLVLTSFLIRPRNLKTTIILIELLFWVFKFFYFKKGYDVGIASSPDPIISFYDSVTLALRLFILSGLLQRNIKTVYILLATYIILGIKIFGLDVIMIYKEKYILQRVELTKEKLVGEWVGNYEYDTMHMNKAVHIIDSVAIRFDANHMMLFDFQNIDSIQLSMEFYSEFNGFIYESNSVDWGINHEFGINNLSRDSMEMILTGLSVSGADYRIKMIKSATKE